MSKYDTMVSKSRIWGVLLLISILFCVLLLIAVSYNWRCMYV